MGADARVFCKGSEDLILNEKIDFAFSSPPYFNHEIYIDEGTQSCNKYPEYKDWLEGYWRKTVQNIKTMMKQDAIFGINIGNNSNGFMKQIAKDCTDIIESEGFILTDIWYMATSISHLSTKNANSAKLEPIYFYALPKPKTSYLDFL